MKVVVAPDSFKGSVSAKDICLAVETGIKRVFSDAIVDQIPLADGGEGTMENLVFASNGSTYPVNVTGPLGDKVQAAYGVMGDGMTVVIEMAQASGLPLVPENKRNPMVTTSYGTGELIKHALHAGYRKFIIGLGGSATNDGGVGMLQALGINFYDENGKHISKGGRGLLDLKTYDGSGLDTRVKESHFTIASDVTNRLCGPNGASAIFGPQKGATPEMIDKLDMALNNFAEIVEKKTGINVKEMQGGGAAGGMGAALLAFLGAEIKSGINVVMEQTGFEERLKDADLLITGEGKLDGQTLSGKVIKGVCAPAVKQDVPIIALCGTVDIGTDKSNDMGLLCALSIVPGPCSLETALREAPAWITERTEAIMQIIKHYK
ncbi:glycerate kinase [Sediminibacillus massiliensis]|uniref:glycerate kinase n=1 Tax=Sediminibacillus massiliensis TaxID=1926277 RepID=UPI0009883612|nr:glycerate kinase [Sediminibacillus massiliensis]